jgi:hypothetical protein
MDGAGEAMTWGSSGRAARGTTQRRRVRRRFRSTLHG